MSGSSGRQTKNLVADFTTHDDGRYNRPMTTAYLNNHFIVAMPGLAEEPFANALCLICQHDEEGALGVILNQPTHLQVTDIFEQLELSDHNPAISKNVVMFGGPVQQDRGLVLHRPWHDDFESSLTVSDNLSVTTSRDVLEMLASGEGPSDAVVAVGYAGWGMGQLEAELADNAWLSIEADTNIV
ncbi:MAG: YqgE/AlgH family protein, partial [Gammaproteobacteria bacterium]|nr:YqgE/AlgH family protein [Gammaproteobacteria bacterium]